MISFFFQADNVIGMLENDMPFRQNTVLNYGHEIKKITHGLSYAYLKKMYKG